MFQRFQIQLQQDVGVQNTVLHTFQQNNGIIVKVAFFQFEVVVFSIVSHRQFSPLLWNGPHGPSEGFPGRWIGKVSAPLLTSTRKALINQGFLSPKA